MKDCSQPKCYAPVTTCALGTIDHTKCTHWQAKSVETGTDPATGEILFPWTGNPFGSADIGFVASVQRPRTVGIVGAHNAGKTTLLAAWYLLIASGLAKLNGTAFAGSFTLAGWEAIAGNLRWQPQHPPGFPEHTVSSPNRTPGLLHLQMVSQRRGSQSFLFADAPGEWFKAWGINRDSPDAAGARWIAANADMFLLIADREALSGPARGTARSGLQFLAKRLGAEQRGRPVALVWTKSDVPLAPEMERAVREIANSNFTDLKEFSVTIRSTESEADARFSEILRWLLGTDALPLSVPAEVGSTLDPLFLFGRR
jgi:Double-GTPase 2